MFNAALSCVLGSGDNFAHTDKHQASATQDIASQLMLLPSPTARRPSRQKVSPMTKSQDLVLPGLMPKHSFFSSS